MLRAVLLWLSEQPRVFKFVRANGAAQKLASRFVAGETLDAAMAAVRRLNATGITVTLDALGEAVRTTAEAVGARDTYLDALDRIKREDAASHVSLKLTQMGLDVDERLCIENVRAIAARARDRGAFVRIDMEGSAYTDRTIDLFLRRFHPEYGDAIGVVLQSYLRRTEGDLSKVIDAGARVRLCKGAYKEPADVAFPAKRDVDASYVSCMERLLQEGRYPAIATHDGRIIAHAKAFAKRQSIPAARFEFQMLYGVRRDLQEGLRREGYNVRVYVPFGTQWYPYLMRRLAERPANVAFLVGNLVKESIRRS